MGMAQMHPREHCRTCRCHQRCEDTGGSLRCDQPIDHEGPHRAATGGGRAVFWGHRQTRCAEWPCEREPSHEGHHRAAGRSWWPVEDDDQWRDTHARRL